MPSAERDRRVAKKERLRYRTWDDGIPYRTRMRHRQLEKAPFYDGMLKRLLDGTNAWRTACWIYDEFGWQEVPKSTLYHWVLSYLNDVLWPWKMARESRQPELVTRLERVRMALDELEEYEALFLMQKERITAFRESESKLPIPLRHIDDAMRVALQLLSASSALKQDLGILKRAPEEVNINVDSRVTALVEARYGRESLQRVMADPKQRARVAAIAEKLLGNPILQAALARRVEEDGARHGGNGGNGGNGRPIQVIEVESEPVVDDDDDGSPESG